jgi:hypothetical protein
MLSSLYKKKVVIVEIRMFLCLYYCKKKKNGHNDGIKSRKNAKNNPIANFLSLRVCGGVVCYRYGRTSKKEKCNKVRRKEKEAVEEDVQLK